MRNKRGILTFLALALFVILIKDVLADSISVGALVKSPWVNAALLFLLIFNLVLIVVRDIFRGNYGAAIIISLIISLAGSLGAVYYFGAFLAKVGLWLLIVFVAAIAVLIFRLTRKQGKGGSIVFWILGIASVAWLAFLHSKVCPPAGGLPMNICQVLDVLAIIILIICFIKFLIWLFKLFKIKKIEPPDKHPLHARFNGIVRDRHTQVGIYPAHLEFESHNPNFHASTSTTAGGHYLMDVPAKGMPYRSHYRITAAATNYREEHHDANIRAEQNVRVDFDLESGQQHPTLELSADGHRGTINANAGAHVHLTWNCHAINQVVITDNHGGNHGTHPYPGQNHTDVQVHQTTTFTATGHTTTGHQIQDHVTVTVQGGGNAPTIQLSADGHQNQVNINPGTPVHLTWTCTNTDSVEISENGHSHGTHNYPAQTHMDIPNVHTTTRFTATAHSPGGQAQSHVEVIVGGGGNNLEVIIHIIGNGQVHLNGHQVSHTSRHPMSRNRDFVLEADPSSRPGFLGWTCHELNLTGVMTNPLTIRHNYPNLANHNQINIEAHFSNASPEIEVLLHIHGQGQVHVHNRGTANHNVNLRLPRSQDIIMDADPSTHPGFLGWRVAELNLTPRGPRLTIPHNYPNLDAHHQINVDAFFAGATQDTVEVIMHIVAPANALHHTVTLNGQAMPSASSQHVSRAHAIDLHAQPANEFSGWVLHELNTRTDGHHNPFNIPANYPNLAHHDQLHVEAHFGGGNAPGDHVNLHMIAVGPGSVHPSSEQRRRTDRVVVTATPHAHCQFDGWRISSQGPNHPRRALPNSIRRLAFQLNLHSPVFSGATDIFVEAHFSNAGGGGGGTGGGRNTTVIYNDNRRTVINADNRRTHVGGEGEGGGRGPPRPTPRPTPRRSSNARARPQVLTPALTFESGETRKDVIIANAGPRDSILDAVATSNVRWLTPRRAEGRIVGGAHQEFRIEVHREMIRRYPASGIITVRKRGSRYTSIAEVRVNQ